MGRGLVLPPLQSLRHISLAMGDGLSASGNYCSLPMILGHYPPPTAQVCFDGFRLNLHFPTISSLGHSMPCSTERPAIENTGRLCSIRV